MIGVGSTVWVFDGNHRVYAKDANGRSHGGPIYREHWRPRKIEGETRVSWVLEYGVKVPKKRNLKRPEYCISEAEVEDKCWVDAFQSHISKALLYGHYDATTLRQVAAIIGWEPPKEVNR